MIAEAKKQNAGKILIFDSGIGGLTVVNALRGIAPRVGVTYVADNAAFPYGALEDPALLARVCAVLQRALALGHVTAVVIACNTVSTLMLDQLRLRFSMRIFGVVPPIKPAAEYSRSRVIGLMATPATLRQGYIDDLVQKYAQDCRIIRIGSPELARYAEDEVRGQLQQADRERIRSILQPLLDQYDSAVDAVAVGCTHYPFLLDEFRKVLPESVQWFDPAQPVARHLLNVLSQQAMVENTQSDTIYFTADPRPTRALSRAFAAAGFSQHVVLPMPYFHTLA